MIPSLPIHEIAEPIVQAMRSGNRLVIRAPTGSGKTTQVPQILDQSDLIRGRILVLQPRRLATRLLARRVADEMGCRPGERVGYQTRHESKVGPKTLIRFMTEGVFLRLLRSDPRLEEVGAVILDEFHERGLAADTSLAMVKMLQERHRPDLRLGVMSATIEMGQVSEYLSCPGLEAGGRQFEVNHRYLSHHSDQPSWELAADALLSILEADDDDGDDGNVLVFMPGAYEIRRTIEACRRSVSARDDIEFFALHGQMPPAEQDEALAPRKNRKVIVSTNVAETSITIEGIRHVIDSGLARVHRFDPRRGINVLLVEPISQASADQRAGRAGRTAPGTCTRLWTKMQNGSRPAQSLPEIQRLDLAEVMLQLKSLGNDRITDFPWLQPPGELALEQGGKVLDMLGAIGAEGRLEPIGALMAQFPMHPRLSRLILESAHRGCLRRAALWAALISERDIMARSGGKGQGASASGGGGDALSSDMVVLEDAFARASAARFDAGACSALGVNASACREVQRTHQLYMEACSRSGLRFDEKGGDDLEQMFKCLLVAFSDHLAVRRGPDNLSCALVGQRRGVLEKSSVVNQVGLILPLQISEIGAGGGVKTVLSMVSRIDSRWLSELFPDRVKASTQLVWDEGTMSVQSARRQLFDDLVFEERRRPDADPQHAAPILADMVFQSRLKLDQWDEKVEQWIHRTRCVAEWFPERGLITYDEDDLRVIYLEICAGATRYSQIRDRHCLDQVRNALSWDDQQFVEKMAPVRYSLPSGRPMKIHFESGSPPRGRAKIQDLYGLNESPRIAGGRQRVLLEILGPNFRPVQVTEDLANFWQILYPTLKKELSRRYPKHEWR